MITDVKHIHIADYNYHLPEDRIAKYPLKQRDESRLLVYRNGVISDDKFAGLPGYLPKEALMVFNNTLVIQARIHFKKITGAAIEVFLLEPISPSDYEQMFQQKKSCVWLCMVGNLKKWRGEQLSRTINTGRTMVTVTADYISRRSTSHEIRLSWDDNDLTFADILDAVGELPIPPYLNRAAEESDKTTYQTVYAKIKGSVAAPTAGLHFTPALLNTLDHNGIDREELTLNVGAGTFQPVKSKEMGDHTMHAEVFCVHRRTLEKLLLHNCEVVAVGTTSVRTIESLYYIGQKLLRNTSATTDDLTVEQWEPYEESGVRRKDMNSLSHNCHADYGAECIRSIINYLDRQGQSALHATTRIIIVPGYKFKYVKMLITNFHQPQSTLLLLVSAFVNGDWRHIYDYALSHDFRFLSYGDSSLLIP